MKNGPSSSATSSTAKSPCDLTQLVIDATAGPVPTRPSAIDFPLLKQRYDALTN
jgi:hypothetical protein